MDLKAIGFDYRIIDGTNFQDAKRRGVRKNKPESEDEHSRPQTHNTSISNKDKGRIIDVSL